MSAPAPRIVALGGGTGLPVVLAGLKRALFSAAEPHEAGRERLTAVVTVADDGGSSGRLRRAYGILAPGDIRNCLLALADNEGPLKALFEFRFDGNDGVSGHNLGNLMLAALSRVEGDFAAAVERAAEILQVRGRVLASTSANVSLVAEFEGGIRVAGESNLAAVRRPIRRIHLEPSNAALSPSAREALLQADLVVIGPGSLFTSLIPTLLVRGVPESLGASRAAVVLVMNVMTEHGETDGFNASDHVRAIRSHAPGLRIDHVLLNTSPIPAQVLRRYGGESAAPVAADQDALLQLGCRPVAAPLLQAGAKVRHDPDALAEALQALAGPRS